VIVALQALSPEDLASRAGIDLADARRIVSLVHRSGALPERSPATIRRAALDRARARGDVPGIERVERRASSVDPFVKFTFRLHDGAIVETVRIPLEKAGRFSVCVSSQVGCALACSFCATGTMGLKRNLETWEIIEQVRRVRRDMIDDPPTLQGDPRSEAEATKAQEGRDGAAPSGCAPSMGISDRRAPGLAVPSDTPSRAAGTSAASLRIPLGIPAVHTVMLRTSMACAHGSPRTRIASITRSRFAIGSPIP